MIKFGKILGLINAIIFFVYGLFFATFPTETSLYVTGSKPLNSVALMDMRATYGGMSMAIGIVLAALSLRTKTLRTAIKILLVFMISMAITRLLGINIDGPPNDKMYYYLSSEIIIAILCYVWLLKVNLSNSQ